jgi:hypothetical protein
VSTPSGGTCCALCGWKLKVDLVVDEGKLGCCFSGSILIPVVSSIVVGI